MFEMGWGGVGWSRGRSSWTAEVGPILPVGTGCVVYANMLVPVLFMRTCLSQCLMGSLSPPPPRPPPPPRVHHQLRPVVAALWKSLE